MSRPTLETFDPTLIKWHDSAMDHYVNTIQPRSLTDGLQIVLFSGAVGSAKSLIMEHMISLYMVNNPNAHVGIGRLAMPDLKSTLYKNIVSHIPKKLYTKTPGTTTPNISLINGSKLTAKSWSDYNMEKMGSHEYHAFAIEEGTESDRNDAYMTLIQRIRLNPEEGYTAGNILFIATNPNSPSHWMYKDIVEKAGYVDGKRLKSNKVDPNIHIFYSRTLDNPFLDKNYRDRLASNLSPKLAERMLEGKWVDIAGQGVYFAYDPEYQYKKEKYHIDLDYPIHISFDFNVGNGKPASTVVGQYINDTFHIFKEYVVDGANTYNMMDEIIESGLLDLDAHFIINGDYTGFGKDSTAASDLNNDFAIIEHYLSHHPRKEVSYELIVPLNPAIKVRHNLVNRYCLNMKKQVRLFIYEDCPTVNRGMISTVLKKGSSYQEDDGPLHPYQHVTTALGYFMYAATLEAGEVEYHDW